MSLTKKILCICIISILVLFISGCSEDKVVKVTFKEKVLCAAELVENHVSFSASSVIVDIPPNAAITDIYAFIFEGADDIRRGEIAISSDNFITYDFLYYFDKDPAATTASYETSFIHPICVGPDGVQVQLTAIGVGGPVNAGLVLNVAYCPDYCEVSPCD